MEAGSRRGKEAVGKGVLAGDVAIGTLAGGASQEVDGGRLVMVGNMVGLEGDGGERE